MTAREIAARLRAISAALPVELVAADQMNLADLLSTADGFSSGAASPETLRAANHPYARRRGSPLLDPGIINRQSGVFLSDWRATGPQLDGGTIQSAIFNIDPKAAFLEQKDGASNSPMFARPIAQRIAAECRPRIRQRRVWALQRALIAR